MSNSTPRVVRVPPTKHAHTELQLRRMTWDTIADHLIKEHGWTERMIAERGRIDNGEYLAVIHKSEHATASQDPPGYWKDSEK